MAPSPGVDRATCAPYLPDFDATPPPDNASPTSARSCATKRSAVLVTPSRSGVCDEISTSSARSRSIAGCCCLSHASACCMAPTLLHLGRARDWLHEIFAQRLVAVLREEDGEHGAAARDHF